jgi:hypothetical protein
LIGGALSPFVTRIGRKRDDEIALRTEWARRLLLSYRKINGGQLANSVEVPPVDLELWEPRTTAQMQFWMGYRQLLANIQWSWLRLDDAKNRRAGAPDPGSVLLRERVGREATKARERTQIVLAEWARGSRKWPRWRFAFMARSTGRQIRPAARRLQIAQGFDPDKQ